MATKTTTKKTASDELSDEQLNAAAGLSDDAPSAEPSAEPAKEPSAEQPDEQVFATPAQVTDNGLSISITRAQLRRALTIVKPAVSTKSTLPVLSHVLLRTSAGNETEPATLRIMATNLEIAIACDLPLAGMPPEAGATTLPAGIFTDFVNTLPADALVKLTTDPAMRNKTKIETPRSRATLASMQPSEFPTLAFDTFGQHPVVQIDLKLLRLLIDSVASAAAKDDSRPVFTAIQCAFEEGKITAAAADAFRLSAMSIAAEVPAELVNRELLIPARALTTLIGVLPAEGMISLMVSQGGAMIFLRYATDDMTIMLASNLLGGQFPRWQAIVPKRQQNDTLARFSRRAAANALKAVQLFARDNANIVRLYIDTEARTVTLHAQADEIGDTSQVIDAEEVSGPSGAIILNSFYLKDALNVLTGANIDLRISMEPVMGLDGKTNPHPEFTQRPAAVYAPDGAPEQIEHYVGVVMPMHQTR